MFVSASMRVPSFKAASLVFIISLSLSLIMVAVIRSQFIRSNTESNEYSVATTEYEYHYEGYYDVIRPLPLHPYKVDVRVPRRVRLSESKVVVATLASDQNRRSIATTGDATLTSADFTIAPKGKVVASGAGDIQWQWVIQPHELGKHAIIVQLSPLRLSVPSIPMQPPVFLPQPNSISAEVEVVDAAGLSAKQREILSGCVASVTVIGTILGLPIWGWISRQREGGQKDWEKP